MKNAFKKINDNFYIINFPNKTKEVYFEIYLKTGYSDESEKEFGVGHLLEHYLIESIPNREKIDYMNGSINYDFTNYYIKSTNKNILRDVELFLDGVLEPEFEDSILLKREKKVLENEIRSKVEKKAEAWNFLLGVNFGKSFPYARNKIKQISNTRKISLNDLEKHHSKIFNKKDLLFVISGYDLEKEIEDNIKNIIKKYKLSEPKRKKVKKYPFLDSKLVKNSKYCWNNEIMTNLCFDLPAKITKNGKNLKVLNILKDYFESSKFYFSNEIRKNGIYSADFEWIIWKNTGLIILSAEVGEKNALFSLEKLKSFIETIKEEGISKKDLLKLKKIEGEKLKKSFDDNMKRLSWIVNDILVFNKITLLEEDLKELAEIDSEYIKKFSKQVLNLKKSNVIVLGKNSNKIKF